MGKKHFRGNFYVFVDFLKNYFNNFDEILQFNSPQSCLTPRVNGMSVKKSGSFCVYV